MAPVHVHVHDKTTEVADGHSTTPPPRGSAGRCRVAPGRVAGVRCATPRSLLASILGRPRPGGRTGIARLRHDRRLAGSLQSTRRRRADERRRTRCAAVSMRCSSRHGSPRPPRPSGSSPSATTTHTEPFHVSKAIATLDYVSEGRAGVQARVSATEARGAPVRPTPDRRSDSGRAHGLAGHRSGQGPVRRGGGLRRGVASALGQLGRRRRDP